MYVGAQDEGKSELETQERWREQEALGKYFDKMGQWLDDENRPLLESKSGDQRRRLARTETLAVLSQVGPNGKRAVLEFLKEHGLIQRDDPIVRLVGRADLSGVNLRDYALLHANLDGTNLSGADLSDAKLSGSSVGGAAFSEALRWGDSVSASNFDEPTFTTTLSGANLSGAILKRTRLAGCYLVNADFEGADLERADLRGANLKVARNLTQEQIEQAYGSYQLRGSANRRVAYASRSDGKAVESL